MSKKEEKEVVKTAEPVVASKGKRTSEYEACVSYPAGKGWTAEKIFSQIFIWTGYGISSIKSAVKPAEGKGEPDKVLLDIIKTFNDTPACKQACYEWSVKRRATKTLLKGKGERNNVSYKERCKLLEEKISQLAKNYNYLGDIYLEVAKDYNLLRATAPNGAEPPVADLTIFTAEPEQKELFEALYAKEEK